MSTEIHQGVVTVLEDEGVEKNQKVTLEGKESLKGNQRITKCIQLNRPNITWVLTS